MRACLASSFVLLLTLAVSIAGLPRRAIAQAADTSELSAAIARLQPQATIRAYSNGVLSEGQFNQTRNGTLWLTSSKGITSGLPLFNVDSLFERYDAETKGAFIGGAVGAIIVSFLFIGVVDALCEGGSPCDHTRAILAGVPVGFGAGAIVGAILGTTFRHWQRRYP
jgi:hypothetical protein